MKFDQKGTCGIKMGLEKCEEIAKTEDDKIMLECVVEGFREGNGKINILSILSEIINCC